MIAGDERSDARLALTLSLELSHGTPGASARVELHERATVAGGEDLAPRRMARVLLRGAIDDVAERRLEQAIDDLAARGVDHLLLDCGGLSHIDFRLVPALVRTLTRFESHAGAFAVCGLSRYLRDLFRLAGCESAVVRWPGSEPPLAPGFAFEPSREFAS
jgi:anti-anti-sigma factor